MIHLLLVSPCSASSTRQCSLVSPDLVELEQCGVADLLCNLQGGRTAVSAVLSKAMDLQLGFEQIWRICDMYSRRSAAAQLRQKFEQEKQRTGHSS